MARTQEYRIVLRDTAGHELSERNAMNLKDAKHAAKYLLSAEYKRACESTIEDRDRAEVINEAGEIVADYFLGQ